jgi:hypothetical protein
LEVGVTLDADIDRLARIVAVLDRNGALASLLRR